MAVPHESFFRSKSEEIDEEDLQYYTTERCIEAGEEYNPELKWLESESELGAEVGDDRCQGHCPIPTVLESQRQAVEV